MTFSPKKLDFSVRAYGLGIMFACVALVIALIDVKHIAVSIFGLFAVLAFGTGFVAWGTPYLRIGWASPVGGAVLALLHGLVALLAIFPARFVVGEAIKLPPQYFDVTVGIATIFFYPAMWLLIFSGLAFIAVLTFIAGSYILQISTLPILNETVVLVGSAFPRNSSAYLFLRTGRREWMSRMTSHACGALAICLIAVCGSAVYMQIAVPFIPALKWIAYAADFQSAGTYPGVDATKRLRLLDNGVVAYAESTGRTIKITTALVNSR